MELALSGSLLRTFFKSVSCLAKIGAFATQNTSRFRKPLTKTARLARAVTSQHERALPPTHAHLLFVSGAGAEVLIEATAGSGVRSNHSRRIVLLFLFFLRKRRRHRERVVWGCLHQCFQRDAAQQRYKRTRARALALHDRANSLGRVSPYVLSPPPSSSTKRAAHPPVPPPPTKTKQTKQNSSRSRL